MTNSIQRETIKEHKDSSIVHLLMLSLCKVGSVPVLSKVHQAYYRQSLNEAT